MIARAERVDRGDELREDHYVHLYGVTWADYLRLLEIRGDRSAPRMTYLEGTLEIMSPSRTHDEIKSYIGASSRRGVSSAASSSRPMARGL
jgi:Uma2 family endonuclease